MGHKNKIGGLLEKKKKNYNGLPIFWGKSSED